MSARLLFLSLASAACAFGTYSYDYSNVVPLTPSAYETQNGTAPAATGAVTQFYSSGSLIWTPTVTGAVSTDYEVNTTLALAPGGGTYIEYVRASSNARASSGSCTGTYYSVEVVVPSWYGLAGVNAQVNVNQCSGGTLTNLSSGNAAVLNGSTLRSVVWSGILWVFVDNEPVATWAVSSSSTGQPGIGGYGMLTGSGFTNLAIGPHDVIGPKAIAAIGVRSSLLPTQVALSWRGTTDDATGTGVNGIGVQGYYVSRGSTALGWFFGAELEDNTVSAGTSYTYNITPVDFHGNTGPSVAVALTTPPATSVDPRRVGVSVTGSYWGGGGEQIDMLSGNLNFSLPLVSGQGRPGWQVPVGLSYNSQNWRQDSGTNWQIGSDTGYGYGWSVQIGSITPYYLGYGVDHYIYTDSTGGQYRLDQNSGNIWSSRQGIYIWFDANTLTLHFKNGMFWLMGCVSGGAERDAGTLYPTIIEDVGGNQVVVSYNGGLGLPSGSTNTSGKINTIQDVRNGATTYLFFWTTTASPHLTQIYQYYGGTAITYFSFNYTAGVPVMPPFGYDAAYSAQTATQLTSIDVPVAGSYVFNYDLAVPSGAPGGTPASTANELQQAAFPWGGCLGWSYMNGAYTASRLLREVNNRYMNSAATYPACGYPYETPYPITHSDTGVSGGIPIVHADSTLADMSGNGAKKWTFNNSSSTAWQIGLPSEFDQMASVGGTVLTKDTYTWSQTPTSSNPYISQKVAVKDPGTGSAASAQTNQTLDQYGNTTQVIVYPYNSTTAPLATYNSTYVTTSGYIAAYLRGLLASATITVGSTTTTLVTNTYDASSCGLSATPSYNFDPGAIWTWPTRGYLSSSVTPAGTSSACHNWFGTLYSTTGVDGTTSTSSVSSATDYTMPDTITTPTYSNSLTYNSWLAVTAASGMNGESMALTYDSLGRPASGTSPYGAVTTYGYTAAGVTPVQQTSSGPNGFARTTLDGFGRAIKVERGPSSSSIVSWVDTIYQPCACSPLGKIQRVSQPYTGSGTEYWTTYWYDGIGRTLTTELPDGASQNNYTYTGNTVETYDATSKWKIFTSDVSGNLTSVEEPNPAGGANLVTTYTYDWMNHLIGSSMTRGTTPVTQTRTFVYNGAGQLTSATNPESGTVAYAYNTDTTLNTKTDAMGQVTVYTYDGSKRITETQIYPTGLSHAEDVCQRVTYTYSTTTPEYGRLVSVQYGLPNPTPSFPFAGGACAGTAHPYAYQESYTHVAAGAVASKTLTLATNDPTNSWQVNASIGVNYTYDTAGRLASSTYPTTTYYSTPPTYSYGYDSMGRPVSMTDNTTNPYTGVGVPWVQNGTYDIAGRMTSMTVFSGNGVWDNPSAYYAAVAESMGYNVNGQMTSQNWAFLSPYSSLYNATLSYTYSGTTNNRQITGMTEASGETIGYTYDSLKRLTDATAVTGGSATWEQRFGYDGFGNMTSKQLSIGGGSLGANSAPAIDPTTNRLTSGYDANGNMLTGFGLTMTYDEDNRVASATPTSGGTEYYGYAPDNKRIYRWNPTTGEEWTFYGARGERIGTFVENSSGFQYGFVATATNVWFGGKLLSKMAPGGALVRVVRDRTGSDRGAGAQFYPYGDEITSTANGTEKYGTYVRDSFTDLDYADQRYYVGSYGRFNTADQYMASAGPGDPGSWNRYAYVGGDPVNNADPSGQSVVSCTINCGGDNGPIIGTATGYGMAPTPFIPPVCVVMPKACNPVENGFVLGSVPPGGWPTSATQAFNTWDTLSPECQQGLKTAIPNTNSIKMVAALTRAIADESALKTAVANTSISWTMLAAIGLRESGFQNINQSGGQGVGIFQIDLGQNPSVTAAQAGDPVWAGSFAAQMLNSNMASLGGKFPGLTSDQLLQATAASYNFGTKNISGNPGTIDVGTTGGNYGSNVMQLMDCFQ